MLAYLLVFHGSRDARSQLAAQQLTQLVHDRMKQLVFNQDLRHQLLRVQPSAIASVDVPSAATFAPVVAGNGFGGWPPVGAAFLECHPLALHQQIVQFVKGIPASFGVTELVLVPVFLLPGVHVREDIPAEVAVAQDKMAASVQIQVTSHLGAQAGLKSLLAQRMADFSAHWSPDTWILLAHGSRRPNANQPIEALAEQLGAGVAYWSVAPDLPSQLQRLLEAQVQRVAIFPYFLFTGGLTDAIAQMVNQLAIQYPQLSLALDSPLNAVPEVADLLIDLTRSL